MKIYDYRFSWQSNKKYLKYIHDNNKQKKTKKIMYPDDIMKLKKHISPLKIYPNKKDFSLEEYVINNYSNGGSSKNIFENNSQNYIKKYRPTQHQIISRKGNKKDLSTENEKLNNSDISLITKKSFESNDYDYNFLKFSAKKENNKANDLSVKRYDFGRNRRIYNNDKLNLNSNNLKIKNSNNFSNRSFKFLNNANLSYDNLN